MKQFVACLFLTGCVSTVAPPVLPTQPKLPPATTLTPCPPQLETLPTDRDVSDVEAWQTVLRNYGEYHSCRQRHDYLRGWVEGQAVVPPEPEPEPKRGLWPF